MKKIKVFLFSITFFIVPFLAIKNKASAASPHLFLSPSSGNYSQNFNIEVRIDTGGQAAGGADVLLEFPTNILNIQEVTKGTAFGELFSSINNNEGKLMLGAYFPQSQSGSSFVGNNGLIATVIFKPVGSGTAKVNFVCIPDSHADSNIVEKTSSSDIIICSANINGTYNIGTGGGEQSTPTPNPTSAPSTGGGEQSTPTPNPTPTSSSWSSSSNNNQTGSNQTMPVSGSVIQTLSLLGLGLFSLLTGIILIF